MFRVVLCAHVLLIGILPVHAHPVPKGTYDRKIAISLQAEGEQGSALVRYRLEVDELTIVLDELDRLRSLDRGIDVAVYRGAPLKFYGEFMRLYAPLLAANLELEVNEHTLNLVCIGRVPSLHDDRGELLGHVRCDFEFRADFKSAARNTLRFREGNFEDKKGRIEIRFAGLSLSRLVAMCVLHGGGPSILNAAALEVQASRGIRLLDTVEPALTLLAIPEVERDPRSEELLRTARATFDHGIDIPRTTPLTPPPPAPVHSDPAHADHDLLRLFLHSNYSIAFLLLIFAGIGAVHALTPGHGKTLVAAYLVGQRGTVWHALLLGLVTTLTHTGVVLVFAIALNFVPGEELQHVQAGLGLAMGLAIACLGFWLLLKRLAGQADHIHVGGGHHHHHDQTQTSADVTWWGLIVLGMTGGIIPCWDAVAILFLCIGRGELWLALPLVLAFSAGLAGVLVLIGILVVKARNFASSHFGEGRLTRALPIVSALVITAIGLWLCYASVHS